MALGIIRSVEVHPDGHLFGRDGGGFSGFDRALDRLNARIMTARQKAAGEPVEPMEPWTMHDIRRSVATRMAEDLQILPHIVEQVLGHAIGTKVSRTYN